MKRFFTVIPAVVGFSLLSLLVGCSGDSGKTMPSGPSVQEQVQKIQNDPTMPPQAKAIAIQQLQARQGGSGGGTTGK